MTISTNYEYNLEERIAQNKAQRNLRISKFLGSIENKKAAINTLIHNLKLSSKSTPTVAKCELHLEFIEKLRAYKEAELQASQKIRQDLVILFCVLNVVAFTISPILCMPIFVFFNNAFFPMIHRSVFNNTKNKAKELSNTIEKICGADEAEVEERGLVSAIDRTITKLKVSQLEIRNELQSLHQEPVSYAIEALDLCSSKALVLSKRQQWQGYGRSPQTESLSATSRPRLNRSNSFS